MIGNPYVSGTTTGAYMGTPSAAGGGGYSAGGGSSSGGGSSAIGVGMFISQIFSAIGTIYAGKAASDIAKYNAMVIEARQELIKVKQDIEFGRYQRGMGMYLAKATAAAGQANIKTTGSFAAVANRSVSQMMIDQAIGQFEYTIEKSDIQAKADAVGARGKDIQRGSYTRALTGIMKGVKDWGMYEVGLRREDERIARLETSLGSKRAGRQT